LIDKLINFFPDDAFYYLQIAYNSSVNGIVSFDQTNSTTGFHPLFLVLNIFLFKLFDKSQILFIHVFISFFSIFFSYYVLKKKFCSINLRNKNILSIALCPLFGIYIIKNSGMESALLYFLIFLTFLISNKGVTSEKKVIKQAIYGLLVACILLTRLDLIIPFSFLYIMFIYILYKKRNYSFIAIFTLIILTSLSPYLYWLKYTQNFLVPISALVKEENTQWTFEQIIQSLTYNNIIGLIMLVILILSPLFFYYFFNKKRTFENKILIALNISSFIYLTKILFLSSEVYTWYLTYPIAIFIIGFSKVILQEDLFSKFSNKTIAKAKYLIYLSNIAVFILILNTHSNTKNYYELSIRVNSIIEDDNTSLAIHDAGAFGYFSKFNVHNLDGLANSKENWDNYLKHKKYDDYFSHYNINYFLCREDMLENEKSFHSLKDLVKNNKIKKIYLENFYTYNLVILNK